MHRLTTASTTPSGATSGPPRDIIATTPVLYLNNHWRRISHPDQNGKIVTTTIRKT
jgi:hypothetical protein